MTIDLSTALIMSYIVSAATATVQGANGVESLLKQLQALVNQSKTLTASANAATTTAFREVVKQLNQLVKDATYQGLNLLQATSSKLAVQFSERTAATLNIYGYNLTYSVTGKRSLFTLSGGRGFPYMLDSDQTAVDLPL